MHTLILLWTVIGRNMKGDWRQTSAHVADGSWGGQERMVKESVIVPFSFLFPCSKFQAKGVSPAVLSLCT